tara:strand:+ start:2016 stop:2681 length:666 start_codon:yes stop_codon:yes gene_type:complete
MSSTFATTFVPIGIAEQIKKSHLVVQGSVQSKTSQSVDGKIVTKIVLSVENSTEPYLTQTELYYPGGTLGEQTRLIHGAPKFSPGEQVVVFAKKYQDKLWIQNLGLGKYSVKNVGLKKVLVNQIFPGHPDMGQITLNQFKSLVFQVKEKRFTMKHISKAKMYKKYASLKKPEREKGRSIASVSHAQKSAIVTSEEKVSEFGLAFLLSAILFLVWFIRARLK